MITEEWLASVEMNAPLITEEWLASVGFKWEQLDRQPSKHWSLWIGSACVSYDGFCESPDALGIEIAKSTSGLSEHERLWHCWIRSDIAGRYSRIIHVRYVYLIAEIEQIISALTARPVNWEDSMYGSLHSPAQAERLRENRDRLDQRINLQWVDRVDREKKVSEIDKHKSGVQRP